MPDGAVISTTRVSAAYLAQRLRPDLEELAGACAARLPSGVTLLDPTAPRGGATAPAWGLVVNARIATGAHS